MRLIDMYAAYNPDEARDETGKWTGDGGSGGAKPDEAKPVSTTMFLSPNIAENLTFDQAVKELGSERQEKFRKMAQAYAGQYAENVSVSDIVGEWSDGAENSLVIEAKMKPEEARYVIAKLGDAAQQKAVIPFVASSGGKDTLWTLHAGRAAMNKARAVLTQNGLEYRSFDQRAGELYIHIFDQGSGLKDNILAAAGSLGADAHFKTGTGEFLGGDTREAGHAAYQKVIDEYKGRKLAASGAMEKRMYDPRVIDDTPEFLKSGRNVVLLMGQKKPKKAGK